MNDGLLGLAVRVSRLGGQVDISAFAVMWLLLASNPLMLLIHRKVIVRTCSRGFLHPARPLPGYYSYWPGHRLVTPYVGHS